MKSIVLAVFIGLSLSAAAQTGVTWLPAADVAAKSFGNQWPRIVLNRQNNPVVIWNSFANKSVYVSRWDGTSFSSPMKVNPAWMNVAGSYWMGPEIASKGDTIYVVMKRLPESSDTSHIYITRSFDGGASFSAPVRVDDIGNNISRFPVVAIDPDGSPLVGFMRFNENDMEPRWVVAKSIDYGAGFSQDVTASGWSGGEVCDCCPGTLIAKGDRNVMLYRDNLNNIRDMWAGISSDGAATFSSGTAIDKGKWMLMYCPSSGPDGVEIGDSLYSVYMSGAGGTELVYFSRYSFASASLSNPEPLTGKFTGLIMQDMPRIAHAGKSVAIAWKQRVDGSDQLVVRFAKNIQNGLLSGYDVVSPASVLNGDVVLADGKIFLVWQNSTTGTVQFRQGTFSPSGIEPGEKKLTFSIYPNPVSDAVIVKTNGEERSDILIRDALGKTVFRGEVTRGQQRLTLNATEWKKGMYFVTLLSGSESHTAKICKTSDK